IGEDAFAGPDDSYKEGPVRLLYENVVLDAGIVRRIAVAGIVLDVQVGDGDEVKALRVQVGDNLLEVREILAIDSERGVALLVVDVEIDDIRWNSLLAQRGGNFAHAGLGIVAVAALLITQAPERRQGPPADHEGALLVDIFWITAGEKIVVELVALGSQPQ